MPKGIWIWPADPRGQRSVLRKVAASSHLMGAMSALAKSKEGMSNTELDDAINDSSEYATLWVVRQLTALGFIEYKVDFFGNPARYQLTGQGRAAYSAMTGQPLPKPVPVPPAPQHASPAPPTPAPATPAPAAQPRQPQPAAPKPA
jgi:hypothetical protein